MSGGVDSSLSAALLCEQGFDVTGVFLKVWADEASDDALFNCPWEQDLADAQAVADQLGIELVVRNVQREYWDRVVEVFLDGYRRGLTPNPDILCNSEVKFGILYDWAIEQGYDYVATGHYAQVVRSTEQRAMGSVSSPITHHPSLHRGNDHKKDQTYFLWKIPRERFQRILFPIGHLPKDQVRVVAQQRGLATAAKKDSQGICFLGKVDVRSWLRRELGTEPGVVVDTEGQVVGSHDGASLYTLGQRHGFTIDRATSYELPAANRPVLYVAERNVQTNTLVVAPTPPKSRELSATALNWLVPQDRTLRIGDRIEARIRHGQQPQPATVVAVASGPGNQATSTGRSGGLRLRFDQAQIAIAPGQSVVFSQGTHILGGGVIE